jgi:hypothetical protein
MKKEREPHVDQQGEMKINMPHTHTHTHEKFMICLSNFHPSIFWQFNNTTAAAAAADDGDEISSKKPRCVCFTYN